MPKKPFGTVVKKWPCQKQKAPVFVPKNILYTAAFYPFFQKNCRVKPFFWALGPFFNPGAARSLWHPILIAILPDICKSGAACSYFNSAHPKKLRSNGCQICPQKMPYLTSRVLVSSALFIAVCEITHCPLNPMETATPHFWKKWGKNDQFWSFFDQNDPFLKVTKNDAPLNKNDPFSLSPGEKRPFYLRPSLRANKNH